MTPKGKEMLIEYAVRDLASFARDWLPIMRPAL